MTFSTTIHQVAYLGTEIQTFDNFKAVVLDFIDHDGKSLGTITLHQSRGSIPKMLPIKDTDWRAPPKEKNETP